jgi:predicted ribosomally synthesized peptide with nif11-like leader
MMTEEQLRAFLERIGSDAQLSQKLKQAKTHQELISICRASGLDPGLIPHLKQGDSTVDSLSDSELEAIAGGWQRGDCVQSENQSHEMGNYCSVNRNFC